MDRRRQILFLGLLQLMRARTNIIVILVIIYLFLKNIRRRRVIRYSLIKKINEVNMYMDKMSSINDADCIVNLRMDRNCFGKLCLLLRTGGGLRDEKFVSVREQVSMFLKIMAHHDKNKTVRFNWNRSGQTISRYFHKTLIATLKICPMFFVKPKPVSVANGNCDEPWKWFKGCLGALDGTYVDVTAPRRDQPQYRTRKGRISVNVLGVCDINMQFVYVLPGWEGSAADSRVLRDAVFRHGGLRVPRGNYYLVDGGYANCEGYLAPYRGKRYHLKEWEQGNAAPQDYQEYFNMKHAQARNIIERCFGRLKTRWKILKEGPSMYPLKTQNRMIIVCAALQNFIRQNMSYDPVESDDEEDDNNEGVNGYIEGLESTTAWTGWRDTLAREMFNSWR